MNIQDAFKMSGINGKIARARELSTDPSFYLMPTNRQKRILMYSDGEQMSIKWEPKFDDLVADDWVVIGQGTVPHYFDDYDDKTLMNIQKALKVGGINCKIARAHSLADPSLYLMPTNRNSGTLMYSNGKQLSILWEPYFDDLVSNDWGIIEKGTIPYYFDDYHDKSSQKERKDAQTVKKLLTDETKRKVTDSIISILAENKCTYSDFGEISKSVTKLYSDNAVLMLAAINIDTEQAKRSIETLANTSEIKI